jgi:hypothetical protein
MDAAGELWGEVNEQGATVPEGWEAAIEPLLSQVRAIERRRTEALARKLGDTPPAAGLAITHARVLDVIAKKWLEDQTVVVRGSKIVSVDPSGGGAAPVGAETIDAGGKALLPGLWDLHAHIDETSGAIDLAAGVTTVRTVGGDADPIDDLAKAFDEGRALGPHLLKGRGGHVAGDEITELSALLLNLVADHDTDAPRALRFARFAEKATAVDLGAKPVRDALRLLKEKKTIVDSTLEVFEALFDDRAGDVGAEWQSVAFRVPPQARRRFLVGGLRAPTGEEQVYAAAFSVCAKMVKALYDQKTPIVAGTESISGLTLPHELELYVKAGIPAADALAFATIGAARAVKVDKTTGSITVGKDADMVLVDGDPLKDVGDVRYSVKVVRSGIVYDSGPVFEASGIQANRRHPAKKLYVLDMFPYPSGAGLHVGHPEGYTATDIVARYKRARLRRPPPDGLGRLRPARRAARHRDGHPPGETTRRTSPLQAPAQDRSASLRLVARDRHDRPGYVRWTQWIFLQLFEKGPRVPGRAPRQLVPGAGTVLANEEVVDGKSEVAGHPVERRSLRQWMLRITAYADRLDADLAASTGPTRRRSSTIGSAERGRGDRLRRGDGGRPGACDSVFTTRADTLPGAPTWCSRPSTRSSRRSSRTAARRRPAYVEAAKPPRATSIGPTCRRPRPASTRRLRDQSRERARGPDLGRRLRHRVRHGRGHGRPRPRRARPRLREGVRSTHRAGRRPDGRWHVTTSSRAAFTDDGVAGTQR